MSTGGNTADNVGSVQGDAFQGHRHDLKQNDVNMLQNGTFAYYERFNLIGTATGSFIGDPTSDTINGTPRTASETRPVNAYVNWIVKY